MGEQHPSKPLPANQLAFEQAAMEEICSRLGAVGDIVRKQYRAAGVAERWGSGAGFYTDFDVPNTVERLPSITAKTFGDAFFETVGVGGNGGYGLIGCQLHQADGILFCLECYTLGGDGEWPTHEYVWRDVLTSAEGAKGDA
jgi:hypothetical protein